MKGNSRFLGHFFLVAVSVSVSVKKGLRIGVTRDIVKSYLRSAAKRRKAGKPIEMISKVFKRIWD
jgi:hypothetical protein